MLILIFFLTLFFLCMRIVRVIPKGYVYIAQKQDDKSSRRKLYPKLHLVMPPYWIFAKINVSEILLEFSDDVFNIPEHLDGTVSHQIVDALKYTNLDTPDDVIYDNICKFIISNKNKGITQAELSEFNTTIELYGAKVNRIEFK